MARVLSLNFRKGLFAQNSDVVVAFLLTITHPAIVTPIRFSTDATQRITTDPLRYGTISRTNTYYFVGVDILMPQEAERQAPTSKMMISNVDRSMIPTARSIAAPPPKVQIEAVLTSAPDTVEYTVPQMDMVNLTYDAATLTFDLAIDAFATEPFPAGSFEPKYFAALFA